MLTTTLWGVSAVAAGAISYGCFWPRSRLYGPVVYRGRADAGPAVALTFDDGPHPQATPAILDILARHNVPAAFFVVGRHAARHPELVRRMQAEGHLVGNHSFDHDYLGMFRMHQYWRRQLAQTEAVVAQIIGRRPRLFRPPMGFKHPGMTLSVYQRGDAVVTWTRRGMDGVRTTQQRILERLLPQAAARDILVLHDGCAGRLSGDRRATVDAVDPLIAGLRGRGLALRRLDELIGQPGYHDA